MKTWEEERKKERRREKRNVTEEGDRVRDAEEVARDVEEDQYGTITNQKKTVIFPVTLKFSS